MQFYSWNSKLALAGLTVAGAFALQQPMQAAIYTVDDFSQFGAGESIEGMGTVHELLDIDAIYGEAVAIFEGGAKAEGEAGWGVKENGTWSYQSNTGTRINGGTNLGGFSEVSTRKNDRNNSFRFTFKEGFVASDFSLLMLDYGDYNAFGASEHNVYLTAFSGDKEVSQASLSGSGKESRGDATAGTDSSATRFGRTNLSVQGQGITHVELTFDFMKGDNEHYKSFDPFIGFDSLSFTAEAADVPEPTSALAVLAVGAVGTAALKRKKNA
ncbi:MAG: PEP-CTERM sorting domain-containing protein [Cyanobacteria bacterium P01_H01_bin.152]